MSTTKIQLDTGYVFYRDHNTGNNFERIRYDRDCYCPICNEKIKNNQDCYLAFANNIFPNAFIHKDCVSKQFHYMLEEFYLESLTEFLIHEYERFKDAQASIERQFKAWL